MTASATRALWSLPLAARERELVDVRAQLHRYKGDVPADVAAATHGVAAQAAALGLDDDMEIERERRENERELRAADAVFRSTSASGEG